MIPSLMSQTVGFIGLGLMGKPMARNLLKKGFSVIAHSRSQGPVDELVKDGATAAGSPAEVARGAKFIITMLPDGPDVEKVLEGDDGVFGSMSKGTVIVDSSTIAPAIARRLAARAKELGARFSTRRSAAARLAPSMARSHSWSAATPPRSNRCARS